MKNREELWSILESLAREEDLELFDVSWPAPRGPVLRVFVSKEARGASVDVEECASLSKRILNSPYIEELAPGNCSIEVSSPGINRRLRLPEHYIAAVGERVKVTLIDAVSKSKRTVTGMLLSCDGKKLRLGVEKSSEKLEVPLENVSEARVDFLF
ncbi:MAG: hypothetical protein GYA55_13665 [SAR324 cluster bacterium]|uniref:Ribosome maturation factor RimP n=1 Tax=SAR324 cluster bacterium TaxID=2024889 RepID=A0A7X9FU27_9DELT|nr:hypothetical protein [SAR324 cluster bacterium]